MTGLTQITVPSDLLKNWEDRFHDDNENVDVLLIEAYEAGHRAGADQELEACINEIYKGVGLRHVDYGSNRESLCSDLRAARRPKPPSLKQQALEALEQVDGWAVTSVSQLAIHEDLVAGVDTIRRALESLPD